MRRQRTVVESPSGSSSPRHGSPRRPVSPNSMSSDGISYRSFEYSARGISSSGNNGSLSFGGSTIGHDDPTLVCTNKKPNYPFYRRYEDMIKNANSEIDLASFLTTSFSGDEKRDPVGDEADDARRSSVDYGIPGDELREQLVELDRTEDEWRARQRDCSSDEIDSTAEFYVQEVGEFAPSPRRRVPFVLNEKTIFEEDEEKLSEHNRQDRRESSSNQFSGVESHIKEEKEEMVALSNDVTNGQSNRRKLEMVVKEMSRRRSKTEGKTEVSTNSNPKISAENCRDEESHDQYQGVVKGPIASLELSEHTKNIELHNECKLRQTEMCEDQEQVPISQTNQVPNFVENESIREEELEVQNEEAREQELKAEKEEAREEESEMVVEESMRVQSTLGPARSEESELVFEYPSTDEQSIDETHRLDYSQTEPATEVTETFLVSKKSQDIEASTGVPDFKRDFAEIDGDGDEIVRKVQERLQKFSSCNLLEAPYATNTHSNFSTISEETDFPGLWMPRESSDISENKTYQKRKVRVGQWNRSEGLASQVDLSIDEDDENMFVGSDPIKRRQKSCIFNVCIVLVLSAAIVSVSVFASKLKELRTEDSQSFTESNENSEVSSTRPIVPETNVTHDDQVQTSETPSYSPQAQTSETPSHSPQAQTSETPSHSPQAPTLQPLWEETIRMISGDSIYNASTPQHDAYDWLVNKDPAYSSLISDLDLRQRYIAALFYYSLGGENWIEQYEFLEGKNVCDWNSGSTENTQGVLCNDKNDVIGFVLNQNNLKGRLPVELEELSDMSMIQLRSNAIYGKIPSEYGKLTRLEEIDLRQNRLGGTIPESIFNLPNMKNIFLLRNSGLSGTIPSSIDRASSLEMISLQRCGLTGSIPSTISTLSNLFFVTLMDNMLTGTIPEGFKELSQLEVFELSGNKLTGSIPDLMNNGKLYFVSLYDNKLTGSIPKSISMVETLMFLNVRNNKLDGSIPPYLGELPNLVTFFAENNRLTGRLPTFSGNIGVLQAINLSRNKLTGSIDGILRSDGPRERLVRVDLAHNNLIGSIPTYIGLFDSLSELDLRGNSLTGTIPIEIHLLREMDTLNLEGNQIVGTIPEELGLIEQLVYLNLGKNRLDGTIPDTVGLLERLTILDLNSNELIGSIPTIFGQLNNLDELYLNNNNLTGDLSETFCKGPASGSSFKYVGTFVADCMEPSPTVSCSCCTVCCKNDECIPVSNAPGK